ncbi:hypothetical protein LOZ53_000354 [Ophidiomyces ophidiicola]|nr:hypothetical protein LOZ53_000354 [Ophidiomyces ophidiicola]
MRISTQDSSPISLKRRSLRGSGLRQLPRMEVKDILTIIGIGTLALFVVVTYLVWCSKAVKELDKEESEVLYVLPLRETGSNHVRFASQVEYIG